MIRGLWISAGALTPAMRAQEILANNLANASTGGSARTGWRSSGWSARRGPRRGANAAAAGGSPEAAGIARRRGRARRGADADHRVSIASPGRWRRRTVRFHLAVAGPGYLAVQGPEGELYTRDGTLQLGARRHAAAPQRLSAPHRRRRAHRSRRAAPSPVASDGTVSINGGEPRKLRLVALPEAASLSHAGAGLLRSAAPGETDTHQPRDPGFARRRQRRPGADHGGHGIAAARVRGEPARDRRPGRDSRPPRAVGERLAAGGKESGSHAPSHAHGRLRHAGPATQPRHHRPQPGQREHDRVQAGAGRLRGSALPDPGAAVGRRRDSQPGQPVGLAGRARQPRHGHGTDLRPGRHRDHRQPARPRDPGRRLLRGAASRRDERLHARRLAQDRRQRPDRHRARERRAARDRPSGRRHRGHGDLGRARHGRAGGAERRRPRWGSFSSRASPIRRD